MSAATIPPRSSQTGLAAGFYRPGANRRGTESAETMPDARPARGPDPDIYRSVFERSGMWMARLDPQGRIVEANPQLAEALGRTPAELAGRLFEELLNTGQRERFRCHCAALRAGLRAGFVESVVAIGAGARGFGGQVTGLAVRQRGDFASSIVVVVTPDRASGQGNTITLTKLSALVLEGVAAGASTTELATKLHLSPQGVEYHVTTMLRKFEASNRAALVARAYAAGVLTTGSWPPRVAPEALK
jgi:PAS domain-containing protein